MIIDYIVADPVGNITVLVNTVPTAETRQDIIRKAFELEPSCEQVGFVSRESDHLVNLEMMGYEFCGNATLSSACYQAFLNRLEKGETDRFVVNASGADKPVDVEVVRLEPTCDNEGNACPTFSATLKVAAPRIDESDKYPVVHLEGISHMLVPRGEITENRAEDVIRGISAKYGVPAFGIIIYDKLSDTEAEIQPLVYVPGSQTLVWENGCASGSTAMGYWLHNQTGAESVSVKQTGGIIRLKVADELYLTAKVILSM